MTEDAYNDYITEKTNLVLNSKNVILYGAPGTGKTKLAREIAKKIIGNEDNIVFCQFHPSFDYTDFIEGLRPEDDGKGNIIFKRTDGILKKICKKAITNKNNSLNDKKNDKLPEKNIIDKIINNIAYKFENNKKFSISYNKEKLSIIKNKIWNISENSADEGQKIGNFYDFLVAEKDNFSITKESDYKWIIQKWDTNNNMRVLQNYLDIKACKYKDKVSNNISFIVNNIINEASSFDINNLKNNSDKNSNLEKIFFYEKQIRDFCFAYILLVWDVFDEIDNNSSVTYSQSELPSNNDYVLIIDEINRGDISRIFGEAFCAIDTGYRNTGEFHIQTQYQNLIKDDNDPFKNGFYIPDNLYIIGTMNEIDRSVDRMDFAVRRRFNFIEIPILENNVSNDITHWQLKILNEINANNETLKDIFKKLNKKILDNFGYEYEIGAGYFLKLKEYMKNNQDFDKALESLWKYNIMPLIREYSRGRDDSIVSEFEKIIEKEKIAN